MSLLLVSDHDPGRVSNMRRSSSTLRTAKELVTTHPGTVHTTGRSGSRVLNQPPNPVSEPSVRCPYTTCTPNTVEPGDVLTAPVKPS